MEQYLREPLGAAVFAAGATIAYMYGKAKMNNEEKLKNSDMFKPAFLVALLTYFIVSQISESHESVSKEPY